LSSKTRCGEQSQTRLSSSCGHSLPAAHGEKAGMIQQFRLHPPERKKASGHALTDLVTEMQISHRQPMLAAREEARFLLYLLYLL